jgi:hypothetical protein
MIAKLSYKSIEKEVKKNVSKMHSIHQCALRSTSVLYKSLSKIPIKILYQIKIEILVFFSVLFLIKYPNGNQNRKFSH